MLYNSYGLFFYRCQLILLNIFAGSNFKKRLNIVKKLKWNIGKNKVFIFDTYINPQIKTFSINQIKKWAEEEKLKIIGIVPPFSLNKLIAFAILGEKYIFRRRGLVSVIIKILKLIKNKSVTKKNIKKIELSFGNIFFSQLILFITGKGECQYLLERIE